MAETVKKHAYRIRQIFDGSSTAFQVLHGVDLSGKYALVTGACGSIGYEIVKSLAAHGCNVLLADINMEAARKVIENIIKETNAHEDNLKPIHLDLSSLQNVKRCAAAVDTLFSDHLDIVILNAGIFGLPYTETEDNIEKIFQVNHLSHMYLAILLEPLLKKGSRVVFVSSESHRMTTVKSMVAQRKIAHTKDTYSYLIAYHNSKLYNIFTAKILSEEWINKGICVNSVNPGNMIYSNMSTSWWLFTLIVFVLRPFTKSLQQAAATSIYAATAAELEGVTGLYFNNCFYCEESALARDKVIAREVFAMSLKMIADRMGIDDIRNYIDKYAVKNIES